jgi:hypothetical protein
VRGEGIEHSQKGGWVGTLGRRGIISGRGGGGEGGASCLAALLEFAGKIFTAWSVAASLKPQPSTSRLENGSHCAIEKYRCNFHLKFCFYISVHCTIVYIHDLLHIYTQRFKQPENS